MPTNVYESLIMLDTAKMAGDLPAVQQQLHAVMEKHKAEVLASDAISNANEEGLKELGRIGVYLMNVENCLSWISHPAPSEAAAMPLPSEETTPPVTKM